MSRNRYKGECVPLREHVDRVLAERENAHKIARDADQRALELVRSADMRALDLARENVELRLEKLNELRSEVIQDRGSYMTVRDFETQLAPIKEFKSRALGMTALAAAIFGAVGAALMRKFGF